MRGRSRLESFTTRKPLLGLASAALVVAAGWLGPRGGSAQTAGETPVVPAVATATTVQAAFTAPFDAWVDAENVVVLPSRTAQWPSLGIVRFGDTVHVLRCEPDCADPAGTAYLEPFGAIALRRLRPMPRSDAAIASGPDAEFGYARVIARGVVARAAPDPSAEAVREFEAGDEIFLRPGPPPSEGDWLARPDGSFVRARDVRLFEPSTFAGWREPPTRFAFARMETTLTRPDGTTVAVPRYARFTHLGTGRGVVRVEGGTLPWAAVRTGRTRRRPRGVPSGAKWTHVDLNQQVLTAYEGDTLVFATMVSAGLHEGTTQRGRFRVVRKALYTTMKASASESSSYYVEGVAFTQYFHGSVAFHMAYWHDRFGTPMSHGCVNLSPADARWLFEWSPGDVPRGWRVVNPLAARMDSLYVHIDRARR